jgi:ATP-binding cassette, subfamily B, bacterial MsbA
MKTFKRLIKYLMPLRHWLPEALMFSILAALFGTMNFLLLQKVLEVLFETKSKMIALPEPIFSFSFSYVSQLFNYWFTKLAFNNGKFSALLFVCSIIFLCTIMANIFRYLLARLTIRLRLRLISKLRNQLYTKYLNQSLSFYQSQNKGGMLNTIINEVNEVEYSLVTNVLTVIKDVIQVIVSFTFLFMKSPQLTYFTLVFIPVVGFVIGKITRPLKRASHYSQEYASKIVQRVEETLGGIKVIQGFSAQRYSQESYQEVADNFTKSSKKLSYLRDMASPVSETLGIIAALCLVLYGANLIFNGTNALSGEDFITYIVLYYSVVQPMKALSNTPTNLQRGLVAAEKIFTELDAPIAIENTPNATEIIQFDKGITLQNISFAYNDNNVLNQVSLTIPKGKTIALVGESGSGKTTISDLILRFYDPQQGSILIDDVDIRNYTLESYRNLFGVVTQDPVLFNTSIKDNILFGKDNVSNEALENAAKAANAMDFIRASEDGFETNVGDRGMKLSGGQKQRVTIARALLKNPPILILDEATSALDTESEKLVQDAINKVIANRTCVLIAHRLSTIQNADEIVVLQKGQIVERGSHEQLLANNGYYAKLVQMQAVK